jgi:hypothetical protein
MKLTLPELKSIVQEELTKAEEEEKKKLKSRLKTLDHK